MANEQFVSRYRKYGEEQPYWKAGIFKIRLPFIHYAWSIPEMVQAVFMCATCLGAIPVLTEVLGVSYEVALSMVIYASLLTQLTQFHRTRCPAYGRLLQALGCPEHMECTVENTPMLPVSIFKELELRGISLENVESAEMPSLKE